MSFRDGNPANAPGAVLIYPADNPAIVYDKQLDRVSNKATGEWAKFTMGDREDSGFHLAIMNNPKSPITVDGYFGSYDSPNYGPTVAYNITHVSALIDQRWKAFDYPIANIADFLNKYPHPYAGSEHIGHRVIIDNHRWRGAPVH
jgi:hypothetical protein